MSMAERLRNRKANEQRQSVKESIRYDGKAQAQDPRLRRQILEGGVGVRDSQEVVYQPNQSEPTDDSRKRYSMARVSVI
jgi:hypothetical protein